jgi:hypothetical protein
MTRLLERQSQRQDVRSTNVPTQLVNPRTGLVVQGPPVYGYMRVPCDLPDEKVWHLEQDLRAYAAAKRFCFVAFFYEFVCGSQDAFNDLVGELQRAGAHYVLVPTLRHLARNILLQNMMLARLEFDAAAEVLTLGEIS